MIGEVGGLRFPDVVLLVQNDGLGLVSRGLVVDGVEWAIPAETRVEIITRYPDLATVSFTLFPGRLTVEERAS